MTRPKLRHEQHVWYWDHDAWKPGFTISYLRDQKKWIIREKFGAFVQRPREQIHTLSEHLPTLLTL